MRNIPILCTSTAITVALILTAAVITSIPHQHIPTTILILLSIPATLGACAAFLGAMTWASSRDNPRQAAQGKTTLLVGTAVVATTALTTAPAMAMYQHL